MSGTLIHRVAQYCWSNKFLDIFRKYFEDHGPAFIDAPEICGGEHNMEYYALFQDYLKVYEDTLTEYLDSIGCTVEELYAEVRETKDQTHDAYLLLFIDCLVASADYESFYKVMLKEGKKCKALRDGGKTGSGWVSAVDFKADEKGSPSSGSGSGTGVGANVRSPSSSSMTSDVKWADEGKKSDRVDNKDDSFGYK